MLTNIRQHIWFTFFSISCIILCLSLGYWQVERLIWKNELISQLDKNKDETPITLSLNASNAIKYDCTQSTDANCNIDTSRLLYRPVHMKGHFLHKYEFHLAGKYLNKFRKKKDLGYHIITPFAIDDGPVVLINRGWVPVDKKEPDSRPDTLTNNTISLQGIFRKTYGTPPWYLPQNDSNTNMWFWIDVPHITNLLNAAKDTDPSIKNVTFSSILIQQTSPYEGKTDDDIPYLLSKEIKLYNQHMAYIVTWFGMAIAIMIISFFYLRTPQKKVNHDTKL